MRTRTPAESDINAALWDEIKAGYSEEAGTEYLRLDALREVTADAKEHNKSIPGLGKKVAELPARDFFRLVHKYGHQEVMSKPFIRYMQKAVPETKVASI